MTFFFFILAALALFAALHPYTTYPLSLWALKRLGIRQPEIRKDGPGLPSLQDGATRPRLAILMCVHNEQNVITARMNNLLHLVDAIPGTEVLVYVDGSTDETEARLREFGDRIRLFVSDHQTGKTPGMNLLVTKTEADLIVFTDAAVKMSEQSLPAMLQMFNDPDVGCVCARIVAVNGGADGELTATADTSIKYWAFDASLRALESEVASVIGAHGPLFAIRRQLHEPAPPELFDDFWVSMAILYAGHRVVQANEFVGYKAIANKQSDEFTRKTRIACQSYNIHRGLLPRLRKQSLLIKYCYLSHKTLRWMTIFSLITCGVFATMGVISGGGLWLALLGWCLAGLAAGLGYFGLKPFDRGFSALAALVANGRGVIQSLRGTTYQTWSPVKSAREASHS
ncbi:MAG: glycosyltransferase [Burkholderiaceae bacterium]